ncbi:MAG: OB-fold nucleic acid binding domain-containing protein [Planctomycetaceae bacterium]
MSRRYVNTLADGESIDEVYLLADKQLRANRNADLYLLAQLRDRTGQISGLMWNVSEGDMARISAGSFVRIRGKVQAYQGNLQVILNFIATEDDTYLEPPSSFRAPSVAVDQLLGRVKEILGSIDDRPLRTLMDCFVNDREVLDGLARRRLGLSCIMPITAGCSNISPTCWRPATASSTCTPRSIATCCWRASSSTTSARSGNSPTTPRSSTPTKDS